MKKALIRALALCLCLAVAFPAALSAARADGTSQSMVRLRVSSVWDSTHIYSYTAANLIDRDDATSWQFNGEKTTPLTNAYVCFQFSPAADVRQIWLKNGHWGTRKDGLNTFLRNGRPTAVKVAFRYGSEASYRDEVTLYLSDDSTRADWQRFDLGQHTGVSSVRVAVDGYKQGTVYRHDVVIAEIALYGYGTQDTSYTSPSGGLYGLATQKIATRKGPGTSYEGGPTYPLKGQYVRVLSRAFDSANGIWWVKIEITQDFETQYLWTGYKRFDSKTLPLSSIPIEQ